MKSTALIIATLVAAGSAPIAAAQEAGGRTIVASIQERGYMGVQIAFEDGALVVSGVLPGTPAEEAGLQVGDRIMSIGDVVMNDEEKMAAFLAGTTVGQVLALHVERGDKHADIRIQLVSLIAVQPELIERPTPIRSIVRTAPPVAVERIAVAERPVPVTIVQSPESDVATDRLQSSRVQAITRLRSDARLKAMDQRSQAERERGRRIDELRLDSEERFDFTLQVQGSDPQRRSELRERADARKARADARREVAARKRAEDREAVNRDQKKNDDVVDGTAEDRRLDELRRELENLRTELDRLRAQIRKLSREAGDR